MFQTGGDRKQMASAQARQIEKGAWRVSDYMEPRGGGYQLVPPLNGRAFLEFQDYFHSRPNKHIVGPQMQNDRTLAFKSGRQSYKERPQINNTTHSAFQADCTVV